MKSLIEKAIIDVKNNEKKVSIYILVFLIVRGLTFEEAPFTILPILTAFAFGLELIRCERLFFSISDVILLFGMFSFYLFWGETVVLGLFFSIVGYLYFSLGKNIIFSHYNNDKRIIEKIVIIFSVAILLLGVLEYIPFMINRITNPDEWIEVWPSFWKHDMVARTNYDVYFAPVSGLLIYGINKIKKDKLCGVISIITAILAVLITCWSEGRMVLGAAGLTVGISLILLAKNKWTTHSNKKIIIGSSILVLLLGVIGVITYNLNAFNVKTMFESSWLNGSMGFFRNIRFNMKYDQTMLIKDFPFGRCTVPLQYSFYNNLPYDDPHDSWLFIARKGGIIPFLLIVIFCFRITYLLFKLWKENTVELEILLCMTGVYYSISFYAWCESIVHARNYMWIFMLFISGIIEGLYLLDKKVLLND